MGPKEEQEWADAMPDEDGRDDCEPTYRDGSVQNECWAEPGYTRDCD